MKILQCGVCQQRNDEAAAGNSFDSFYPQLRQHYEQQHLEGGSYRCPICQKTIISTNRSVGFKLRKSEHSSFDYSISRKIMALIEIDLVADLFVNGTGTFRLQLII